ncbi:hypothetical protein [Streptomyces sp. NPDC051219]|uniref:hypothetical protein n=1 Tax=Streptomyces sp. NPDC051219 TaxID=3155283 RepID=UPI003420AE23
MAPVYTPARVARAIRGLVRVPRREVVVGPLGRGLLLQTQLAPGITEKVLALKVDRNHFERHESAPTAKAPCSYRRPGPGAFTAAGTAPATAPRGGSRPSRSRPVPR